MPIELWVIEYRLDGQDPKSPNLFFVDEPQATIDVHVLKLVHFRHHVVAVWQL